MKEWAFAGLICCAIAAMPVLLWLDYQRAEVNMVQAWQAAAPAMTTEALESSLAAYLERSRHHDNSQIAKAISTELEKRRRTKP